MKKYKIHPALYLKKTKGKGLGVYTEEDLYPRKVIELSSVLSMPPDERAYLEKTALKNYIFEWEDDNKSCIVAFGYISMYNHSYTPNCEYEMDFEKKTVLIRTLKKINAGDELTINYNGDVTDQSEMWFDLV